MTDGTAFCTKCGAKMAPVATTGGAAAAPAPQAKSSSGLKVVLIIFGVLAVICVIGIGALVGGAYFLKHKVESSVKTDSTGKVTSVDLGGLKIDASKDASAVAAKLGVEVYPGAKPENEGASSVTIGGVSTAHAQFTSDDSLDDVFHFYQEKYPNANLAENDNDKTLMQGSEDKELLTIGVTKDPEGKTLIHITRITKGVR
jgi:hypothetical protein